MSPTVTRYTRLPAHEEVFEYILSKDHQDKLFKSDKSALFRRKVKVILLAVIIVSLVGMYTIYRQCVRYMATRQRISTTACSGGVVRPGMHSTTMGGSFRGLATHYTLPSGDEIPSIALGVWKARKGEVGNAVKSALKSGYRHIDNAWIYGNEREVGQAIVESGVPRKDIWLTSKLWNTFHAPEDIEPALDETLKMLRTDYLDLYLIHWPIAVPKDNSAPFDKALTGNPYPTWKKLEEMVDKGKVRNIGVSNFNVARIQNLTANPLKYPPAVNQVELNYFNPQPDLLAWAKENSLLLEAYSPLGSSAQVKKALSKPVVKSIAEQLDMTPAQVYISWHIQRGVVVLPKSVHPSRIEENFQVMELPEKMFQMLESDATSHPPERIINPSESWGLDWDIFEDGVAPWE